ncbi:MAG TPA: XrtA/PEP-CTERM system-associated ATPase [Candidatus Sulfotelmatobacter sp.]|nr:XrtA/PEP-CTERM system-associated ATPase [Candidatus Sulfotelmatobacter sp.]
MYQNFYSLNAMPFQLTPDNRFYFGSQEHRRAMAFLEYGLSQREGFVVVTGEIGAGKTMLVEHLLSTLHPDEFVVARVVTTQLGGFDTLRMIATSFAIPSEGVEKGCLLGRVRAVFSSLQTQGRNAVVIVDEAQSLTKEAIEELRMLSNMTSGPRAPFQGIFLGQPEFRLALSSPELQQLRQRVIASCHLGALSSGDTRKYIEHRLTRAGWTGDPEFSDNAFEEIHRYSAGIPRRINSLCSRLLLLGYLEERHAIDGIAVSSVAREMAAELGTECVRTQPLQAAGEFRPEPANESDDVLVRLRRVESATAKHDRAILRILDLALKHLPVPDGN